MELLTTLREIFILIHSAV